jgi:hypothetical protein
MTQWWTDVLDGLGPKSGNGRAAAVARLTLPFDIECRPALLNRLHDIDET